MAEAAKSSSWDILKDKIALNRMIEFVDAEKKRDSFKGLNSKQIADRVESMLFEIHRSIFQDTAKSEPEAKAHSTAPEYSVKRAKNREAIASFATKIFDKNGFIKRLADIEERNTQILSEAFADLYKNISETSIFDDETRRVLDTLVVCISNSNAFQEVHKTTVDFRKIKQADAQIMNDCASHSVQEIQRIFESALSQNKKVYLANPIEEEKQFKKWEDKHVSIAGISFLKHVDEEGEYLVTVNGGLVPYDESLKQKIYSVLIEGGKRLDELGLFEPKKYLSKIENPVNSGFVDGFEVQNGAAPLLCLDANITTGLRTPNHAEFEEFYKSQLKEIANKIENGDEKEVKNALSSGWTKFADDRYASELLDRTNGDARLKSICSVAISHIKRIVAQLDNAKTSKLDGKTRSDKPLLVMPMGGAGSGKSGAEKLINQATNGNFVTASLDEFRKESGIYKVLMAANHHADDYLLVEPFANSMREWVFKGAMHDGLNVLYDGTGIPFSGRYDEILNLAKKREKPYTTVVAGYDTLLHVPDQQKDAVLSTAHERVLERQKSEGRTLPWPVITGKHIQTMPSLLHAFADSRVDRVMMFCKDGEKNTD